MVCCWPPRRRGAVAYSAVQAFALTSAATGAAVLYNSSTNTTGEGLAATSITGTNGVTVYVGQTNTSTNSKGALAVSSGTGKIGVSGGAQATVLIGSSSGGTTGGQANANSIAGITVQIYGALDVTRSTVNKTGTVTVSGTPGSTTTSFHATSANGQVQTLASNTANGGGSTGTGGLATIGAASGAITAADTTIATVGTGTACGGSYGCLSYNNLVAPGKLGVGQGYTTVKITSALTSTLYLSPENTSQYFFIYLAGGINGGSIQFQPGAAGGNAANVIVLLSDTGGAQNIATGSVGTYIWAPSAAANETLAVAGTLTGGVFMLNQSTSSTDTLSLASGAQITPAAWSGWISTTAPEPASMAVLGSGLLGLVGFVRRRRRG